MEGSRRLQLVPDCGDGDLARDAVDHGFMVMLEIWHSALVELAAEVPPGQLRVLLILSRARSMTVGRLADALGASGPATNLICGRMEAKGLLGRGRGTAGDMPVIFLTASARRLVAQIQEQRRAVLEHVLQSLTPAGRTSLASALAEFAAGAVGEVWRAEDLVLGRPVAVKLLQGGLRGPSADTEHTGNDGGHGGNGPGGD